MADAYEGKDVVSGEFRATTSTGGEIILYDPDGTVVDVNETGNQKRLVVTDVLVTSSAAGDVVVFLDAGDDAGSVQAGEVVARGNVAANGGLIKELLTPKYGQIGAPPRVTSPSGTVVAQINGYLLFK